MELLPKAAVDIVIAALQSQAITLSDVKNTGDIADAKQAGMRDAEYIRTLLNELTKRRPPQA